jgi:hypothetical protein
MIYWGLGLAGLVSLGVLVLLLVIERKRSRVAEQLLATADEKLEKLQRQFERFASPDVVAATSVKTVFSRSGSIRPAKPTPRSKL